MINQTLKEVLKFTVVFVCDTVKKSNYRKKKRVENNKNGNGVTRNEPDYRPKPPSSFLLPLLYNKQLFRCNCVEFTFYPSCTVVCFPLSHSPLGRLSVCVSVCGHEQVMEGGRGGGGVWVFKK